ncbi:MAG: 3-deoxy-D-manno-octulosonic acid transferase [Lentisphaerae bacterium ADurb.Bin242]|nr:MAG: 3-deoxy-D-manno-octulosonic acid transferase [Lentisphaerae bacterium ADurb.Bin242]
MLFLYRIFFPFAFLFFAPGLVFKLIRRPGRKKNYAERFGIFSRERAEALSAMKGAVWLHAVSVGETNVALTLLKKWAAENPKRKFVFSTTTTTSQEIAWNKVPPGVEVFFCPVDSALFVKKALRMIRPSALVIFETEIWPNLITLSRQSGAKVILVNARISDRSVKGYQRFRRFFSPVLDSFHRICVQTELDRERFAAVTSKAELTVTGNIKFDQAPAPDLQGIDLSEYFGDGIVSVLACSTHAPEEKLIVDSYRKARETNPALKLVIVPRHAERGNELEAMLATSGLRYHRRTSKKPPEEKVDCLLADTTGELVKFIKSSDVILMGKTFCQHHEGQNIIEPAALGKTIVTGPKMINFRQAFEALLKGGGVMSLASDSELPNAIRILAADPVLRNRLGANARNAVALHAGALAKTITILEENLP